MAGAIAAFMKETLQAWLFHILLTAKCLKNKVQTGAKKSQKSFNINIPAFRASKVNKYYIKWKILKKSKKWD